MTTDQGVDIAIRAITAAMSRDSASGNGAAVAIINDKGFKMLTEDEIKTRLERLKK